ncbi:hypothetical protein DFH06DRAFT_1119167 [Mycena polygramma]|nr:hypothetical protein DFH06DRAFT_1119167 [Mycena polygramma]
MARGRPRLDPDIKQQHVLEAQRRYNEKNMAKRREAARLGMQRKLQVELSQQRAATVTRKRTSRSSTVLSLQSGPYEVLTQVDVPAASRKTAWAAPVYAPTRASGLTTPEATTFRRVHAIKKTAQGVHASARSAKFGESTYSSSMSFLCSPNIVPDPDETKLVHHQGPLYAIVCKEWKGVATSEAARDQKMREYPHAYTWQAGSYNELHRRWVLDCTEYHDHTGEYTPPGPFIPLSPESSPPSSPPSRSASTATTAPPSASPSNLRLSKEELTELANFRPPGVPLSPERAKQQFMRVLGPDAVAPWRTNPLQPGRVPGTGQTRTRAVKADKGFFAVPAPQHDGDAPKTRPGSVKINGSIAFISPTSTDSRQREPILPEVAAVTPLRDSAEEGLQASPAAPPMFAVSGHNRVFQDRARALAAWKSTPGSDLIVLRDEKDVMDFLTQGIAQI